MGADLSLPSDPHRHPAAALGGSFRGSTAATASRPPSLAPATLFQQPSGASPTSSRFRKLHYWQPYEEMITAYLTACSDEVRVGTLHSSFYCNEAYQERTAEVRESPTLSGHETQRQKLLQRFRATVEQTVEGIFNELMEPSNSTNGSRAIGGTFRGAGRGRVFDGVFYFEWASVADGQMVSNHERRACQALLDLGIEGLSVPMITTINIAHYCFTAIALVPIDAFKSTQRPGTAVRIHHQQLAPMALSEEADSMCTEVSLLLGYTGMQCRSCELHRGLDGRVYFIGNADWLPAIAVAKVTDPGLKRSTFQSVSTERLSTHLFRNHAVCWGTPLIFLHNKAPLLTTQEHSEYEHFLTDSAMPKAIAHLKDNDLGDQVFSFLKRQGVSTRFLPVVLEGLIGSLSVRTIAALQMRIFVKSMKDVLFQEFRKAVQLSSFSNAQDSKTSFVQISQILVDLVLKIPEYAPSRERRDRNPSQAGIAVEGCTSTDEALSILEVSDPTRMLVSIFLPACCRRYVTPPALQARVLMITLGTDMKRRLFHELCRQCGLQVLRGKIQGFVAYVKKIPIPSVLTAEEIRSALNVRSKFDRASFSVPLLLRKITLDADEASRAATGQHSPLNALSASATAPDANNSILLSEADTEALESCLRATTSYKAYHIHLKRRLGCFWLQLGDNARAGALLRSYGYAAQGLDSRSYRDIETITHSLILLSKCAADREQMLESIFTWQPRRWLDPPLFMRRAFFEVDQAILSVAVESATAISPGAGAVAKVVTGGPLTASPFTGSGTTPTAVALRAMKRARKTVELAAAAHPDDARFANDIAVEFLDNYRAFADAEGPSANSGGALSQCATLAEELLRHAIELYSQFMGAHHPDTLTTMMSLSLLYVWGRESEKAARAAGEVVTLASASTRSNGGKAAYGDALVHFALVMERFGRLKEAAGALELAVEQFSEGLGRRATQTLSTNKKFSKIQRKWHGQAARRIQRFFAALVARRAAMRVVNARATVLAFLRGEETSRIEIGEAEKATIGEVAAAFYAAEISPWRPCNLAAIILASYEEEAHRRALHHRFSTLLQKAFNAAIPTQFALTLRPHLAGFLDALCTLPTSDAEVTKCAAAEKHVCVGKEEMESSFATTASTQHTTVAGSRCVTTRAGGPQSHPHRRARRESKKLPAASMPSSHDGGAAAAAVAAAGGGAGRGEAKKGPTRVKLTRPSTLEQIARRHGTTAQLLRQANPEYSHCLDMHIVPKGAVINLPANATANVGGRFSTVRKLSELYGAPIWAIRHFNSILADTPSDDAELAEGVSVYIPSAGEIEELQMTATEEGLRASSASRSRSRSHTESPALPLLLLAAAADSMAGTCDPTSDEPSKPSVRPAASSDSSSLPPFVNVVAAEDGEQGGAPNAGSLRSGNAMLASGGSTSSLLGYSAFSASGDEGNRLGRSKSVTEPPLRVSSLRLMVDAGQQQFSTPAPPPTQPWTLVVQQPDEAVPSSDDEADEHGDQACAFGEDPPAEPAPNLHLETCDSSAPILVPLFADLATDELEERTAIVILEACHWCTTEEEGTRRGLKVAAWLVLQQCKRQFAAVSAVLVAQSESRLRIEREQRDGLRRVSMAFSDLAEEVSQRQEARRIGFTREERVERVSIEAAEALARNTATRRFSTAVGRHLPPFTSAAPAAMPRFASPSRSRPPSARSDCELSLSSSLARMRSAATLGHLPHQQPPPPAPHVLEYEWSEAFAARAPGSTQDSRSRPSSNSDRASGASTTTPLGSGSSAGFPTSQPAPAGGHSTSPPLSRVGSLWKGIDPQFVRQMTRRAGERAMGSTNNLPGLRTANPGSSRSGSAGSITPSSSTPSPFIVHAGGPTTPSPPPPRRVEPVTARAPPKASPPLLDSGSSQHFLFEKGSCSPPSNLEVFSRVPSQLALHEGIAPSPPTSLPPIGGSFIRHGSLI